MTSELLRIAAGLGVGAMGMIIMFLCYRQDRKATETRLTGLLEEDQESRRHNTKALTELTSFLIGQNGKSR